MPDNEHLEDVARVQRAMDCIIDQESGPRKASDVVSTLESVIAGILISAVHGNAADAAKVLNEEVLLNVEQRLARVASKFPEARGKPTI